MKFRAIILEAEGEDVQDAMQLIAQALGNSAAEPSSPPSIEQHDPPKELTHQPAQRKASLPKAAPKKQAAPSPAPVANGVDHAPVQVSMTEYAGYPLRRARQDLSPCCVCKDDIKKGDDYRDPEGKPHKRAHRDCVVKASMDAQGR